MRTRLSEIGIDVPPHASGNVKVKCPKCSHERKKGSDPCLSVDVDQGLYHCHHCGYRGKVGEDGNAFDAALGRKAAKRRPVSPPEVAELSDGCRKWLGKRGISPETAVKFGLKSITRRFDGEPENCLAIPFYRDGEIENWKFRRLGRKGFTQQKGGRQCLYGYDGVANMSTIILTEGEVDAWSAAQCGYAACSCPNGAPPVNTKDTTNKLAFIEGSRKVFDEAERVIICGDKDAPGLAWEQHLADAIGPEKCWSVSYPEDLKDLNEVLCHLGEDSVREVIESARPWPVSGVVTFEDYEDEILDMYANGPDTGLPTGWRSVDNRFRLKTGQLHVLTGVPGSGKSEWLDALMINSIRLHGWKWCVFSPENWPLSYHFAKLAEKSVGKPLRAMSKREVETAIADLSAHAKLIDMHDRCISVHRILLRLHETVVRYGVKGFILDPYNELEHARPREMSETEYVSGFLSQLRNFARRMDVAIFVVAHPTKLPKAGNGQYPVPSPYDISGSANWRNKADVCLTIARDLRGDAKRHLVVLHVQKMRNRNLGEIGAVPLEWIERTGEYRDWQERS